jgi:hypothetical protein
MIMTPPWASLVVDASGMQRRRDRPGQADPAAPAPLAGHLCATRAPAPNFALILNNLFDFIFHEIYISICFYYYFPQFRGDIARVMLTY